MNQSTELHELGGALVMYAARLVRTVSRRTSGDVPAASLRLLSQVEELGPIGISSLARADRCSQPTMSSSVANLADKGWATKQVNPTDGRSSLVQITTEGRSVLHDARDRNAEVIAEQLRHSDDHDVDDLRSAVALLQHLLNHKYDDEGNL